MNKLFKLPLEMLKSTSSKLKPYISLGENLASLLTRMMPRQKRTSTYGRKLDISHIRKEIPYGDVVPIIYGRARVEGILLWHGEIKENQTSEVRKSKSGQYKIISTHTEFNYTVSVMFALCEGIIQNINKIWIDGELVNAEKYNIRVYVGSEEQLPDPVLEEFYGKNKAPAYRGIAYVMFQDFPITSSILPKVEFEVMRNNINDREGPEQLVKSIIIIPGSGEFVYDTSIQSKVQGDYVEGTFVQRGSSLHINQHTHANKADALVALDQMQHTLPNLEWVAPVIGWFADSLDILQCSILPGVDYKENATTMPDLWRVGKFHRATAKLITQNNGQPIYGGTVSDNSLLRYLDELRQRNYKIMFYPMIFIDLMEKPWRGRMYGEASSVKDFFNKKNGYNEFILHYANLVKDKVDAFVIGSEMVGLNKISRSNNFPAVDEFVKLAKLVKSIVGPNVLVTYAADWSEYHHTEGGWYHLDPLWSCDAIDFIGIDAYFPLTEGKKEHTLDEVIFGWTSGEGHEYVYKNGVKEYVEQRYAWKDIKWWWENKHVNPDGHATNWQPKTKKIWFTEYGFPSVDCATNQSNVFYSPDSVESFFPKNSEGNMDLFAQALGITATEKYWMNSEMIERKFLWTWDARPFPQWPEMKNVWADGECWYKGHWVQGKLGLVTLEDIILDLSKRAGIDKSLIEFENLSYHVDGFIIDYKNTAAYFIDILTNCFYFDVILCNDKLKCISKKARPHIYINPEHLIYIEGYSGYNNTLQITYTQDADLPNSITLSYINSQNQHNIDVHTIRKDNGGRSMDIDLPIAASSWHAYNIADVMLHKMWVENIRYNFMLPISYAALAAGDILDMEHNGISHCIKIQKLYFCANKTLLIEGVSHQKALFNNLAYPNSMLSSYDAEYAIAESGIEILELPPMPHDAYVENEAQVMLACYAKGKNWKGAVVYSDIEQSGNFKHVATAKFSSTIGYTVGKLHTINTTCVMDNLNAVYINLISGSLQSVMLEDLLAGENAALLGQEIIQFQYAKEIKHKQYELKGLLRGRFGTELNINHQAIERFVLLDKRLIPIRFPKSYLGQPINLKAFSIGAEEQDPVSATERFIGVNMAPFSPVSLEAEIRLDPHTLHLKWKGRNNISNRSGNFWDKAATEALLPDPNPQHSTYKIIIFQDGKMIYSTDVNECNFSIDGELWPQLRLSKNWELMEIHVAELSPYSEVALYNKLLIDGKGKVLYNHEHI